MIGGVFAAAKTPPITGNRLPAGCSAGGRPRTRPGDGEGAMPSLSRWSRAALGLGMVFGLVACGPAASAPAASAPAASAPAASAPAAAPAAPAAAAAQAPATTGTLQALVE